MQALDDILAEANRNKYEAWIAEHVEGDGYGQCEEVTRRMAEAFPELTRVRGHYYCWAWGERTHWWLPDGENVVDPTAQQFPSKGKGVRRRSQRSFQGRQYALELVLFGNAGVS